MLKKEEKLGNQLDTLTQLYYYTVQLYVLHEKVHFSTAKLLEDAVRSEGSEPATIALLDGNIHVGLSNENLTRVAETMDSVKVSRRDIAYALNKGLVGGTTVAATMFLAHMAGIRVFATGGIGGVHRGAEETFDISADLIELMQTPVTVVCAGVKSILDIPKTLQFLETHSVNCIVYGEKNAFPGFFTKETTEKGQFSTTDLHDVVQHMEMSRKLGLKAGTILACPIPDKLTGDGKRIEEAIVTALKEAKEKNITSQSVTPFLLSRLNQLTSGESLRISEILLEQIFKFLSLSMSFDRCRITRE
ncbi:unnamed protein product [Nippostrongylus brasiliensis]|uniref:Pseudouridylate synthase n=1 Tax=Nippostrongylus brasiliensis TaxID=27835 RepID=A0A0N4YZI1_NIPBR|nr:unnamed protein product [Nippostrongylus brasiliensis]